MGQLVPEDFSLSDLVNDAEREVVAALRDGLDDGWLVIPQVKLWTDQRDHEIDVVLIHQAFGVLVVEVKGHRELEVRKGKWRSGGREIQPQPLDQARVNAYALRGRLRERVPEQVRLQVNYGVAFPNASAVSGDLPLDASPVQVLTASRLAEPEEAVMDLALARFQGGRLSAADVDAFVSVLLPDAHFAYDPTARRARSRRRLDELCEQQIRTLERLDVNRRVATVGAAGTGKTRLAIAWTRRALGRGERVLLTCYNEPLAGRLVEQIHPDESLQVGAFYRLALGFEGMAPLEIPDRADHAWWNTVAVGHLHSNWHLIEDRFDTIVIDEAQDFSPAWITQLQSLLDPAGARRTLLLCDPAQDLYGRGFVVPEPDDGWTRCELVVNCRNAHEIGRLLRKHLNGAPAPMVAPLAEGIDAVTVDGPDEAVAATRRELDRLLLTDEVDPGSVVVLTTGSRLRDRLRDELGLVPWELRGEAIVCETVHRAKGLEADAVVLVVDDPLARDTLLAIGVARAVNQLVLVAPAPVVSRLGLR